MQDPRITELLEHLGDTEDDGKPTRLANYAGKVKAYLVEIETLRTGLDAASREVTGMEARAASMESQLKAQENMRHDLMYEAQDAAVRAAMSDSAGGAAGMLRQVEERKAKVADFDKGFNAAKLRLERVRISVATKRAVIRKNRDLIALRMNTIASLLDRASNTEPELGAAPVAGQESGDGGSPSAVQPGRGAPAATMARPRKVRRIRVIRRR